MQTYNYLKDSIFNFSKYYNVPSSQGSLNINDFKSVDWVNIKLYLDSLDSSYFEYTTVLPNTNIEKISYDLYGVDSYWDIILLVNDMSPLMDVAFDFDVISETVENKIDEYENNILGRKLPDSLRENLYRQYEDEMIVENNEKLTLKYITKEHIYDFILGLYEMRVLSSEFTKNDVYNDVANE